MPSPRRLSLQLTPLLDMLLIIVFAQYLDMRENAHLNAGKTQAAIVDLAETRERLKALLAAEELLRSQFEMERSRRVTAEDDAQTGRQKLKQSETNLERALQQQEVLASLMTEVFQIPPSEIQRLLSNARIPALEQSPQEMERVRDEFQKLSQQRRGRMIEYLLTYDEIRKRCDVWDFHVDGNGIMTMTAGERTKRIRLPTLANDDVDIQQFNAEVYQWYRSLPQPKSLVVILLTYDRTARIATMDGVRRALPELVSRMHADYLGQVRFEYADLGFRLE